MSERMPSSGELILDATDITLIGGLLLKVGEAQKKDEMFSVITRDYLAALLSDDENFMIDRIYAINPYIYGFKAPRLGSEPIPDNLVRVDSRPYRYKDEPRQTKVQYVPAPTYVAYTTMAAAMREDTGRELLIESSYRSDAYQAVAFLRTLRILDFDVAKTAQRAAIPGYSEHGTPSRLALDLQNVDGLPSDKTPQDFEGTAEYEWLIAHANDFGFFMSYPKDNSLGVTFEPWHWQHRPNDICVA